MMKTIRIACLFLFVVLFLAAACLAARPQSAQQAGDQTKSDSSATKNTKKPMKTDSPPQNVPPATAREQTPSNAPGSPPPASKPAITQATPPASVTATVWVNTDSGIYHKPGSRYYGKTKKGKYMTETDARKAGYREAKKE